MDRSLVLVTGATGAVGPRVVEALSRSGYGIRTLSLDAPPKGIWPEVAIDARIGDINDAPTVISAMQGVNAVIHLAALLHILNPPDTLKDHYRDVNVGGTDMVVDAARKAGVKRTLFFSTIAVYGDAKGQIINEETIARPDTFYAQTKLEAERIVLAARSTAGEPIGTVLRLGAVYGSRIKGNYRQLLMALKRGWFLPIGQGLNRRTLIYDKDVANAAILALHHPAAAGRLFNVSDGQYHTLNTIIETMCYALGRKPPLFSLPLPPVRWIAGMIEDVTKRVGFKSPIVRSTIDKYTEDIAVDSHLIQKDLGFTPAYDLIGGWQDTVQEMRREGRL
jgi:nucleoside-diphosphate-sugar epimerase